MVGDLLRADDEREVVRDERGDGHRHDGRHGGHAEADLRAPVGLERGRPLVAVHHVDAAAGDQVAHRLHDPGRGPPARARGGDELEAQRVDPAAQRARLAEDDDVVAEVAHAGGELDRVELAAAELQDVRVDDDPHAVSSSSVGSGAGPASRAGVPIQSRRRGDVAGHDRAHPDHRPGADGEPLAQQRAASDVRALADVAGAADAHARGERGVVVDRASCGSTTCGMIATWRPTVTEAVRSTWASSTEPAPTRQVVPTLAVGCTSVA